MFRRGYLNILKNKQNEKDLKKKKTRALLHFLSFNYQRFFFFYLLPNDFKIKHKLYTHIFKKLGVKR